MTAVLSATRSGEGTFTPTGERASLPWLSSCATGEVDSGLGFGPAAPVLTGSSYLVECWLARTMRVLAADSRVAWLSTG